MEKIDAVPDKRVKHLASLPLLHDSSDEKVLLAREVEAYRQALRCGCLAFSEPCPDCLEIQAALPDVDA